MRHKISLTPWFHVYLAAAVLMVPLRWLLAAAAAAAFHELCHGVAIRLLGHPIHRIQVGLLGAGIFTDPMPRHHELICALAGPIGGLLLIPLGKWIGAVSICAGFQSLYNLLPIDSTDGGRALRCGAEFLLQQRDAEQLCLWAEIAVSAALTALGLWGCFALSLGPLPLVAAAIPVYRAVKEK